MNSINPLDVDPDFWDLCVFIEGMTGYKARKISHSTSVNFDIRIDGDDGAEFIEAFSKKFNVDLSGFDFHNYFYAEGFIGPITSLILYIAGKRQTKKQSLLVSDLFDAMKNGKWLAGQ